MSDPAQHIKLSDLTSRIEAVLYRNFSTSLYWIVAEISGHKFYPNDDRHYFDFIEKAEGQKDPAAKVRGVSWKTGSQAIRRFEIVTGQVFSNGIQVLAQVKVEFHQAYGLSLTLTDIDPSFTLGNIERQRRETLERLVKENPDAVWKDGEEYNTRNKELNVRPVIQRIAIIASPNSEGYRDFIHTLETNKFGYRFTLENYFSSVQGSTAEKEMIARLVSIFNSDHSYDCAVIIRGGGAKSDFMVFDSYGLSKAVARFPIPIITGLGHHQDVSIVDMMAHTQTKTPTKAAEYIISHNRQFEEEILGLQRDIIIKTQQLLGKTTAGVDRLRLQIVNCTNQFLDKEKSKLAWARQVATGISKELVSQNRAVIAELRSQITASCRIQMRERERDIRILSDRYSMHVKHFLANRKSELERFGSVVKIMNVENILKRGFAIVKMDGRILADASSIEPGKTIIVSMKDQDVTATAQHKQKHTPEEIKVETNKVP